MGDLSDDEVEDDVWSRTGSLDEIMAGDKKFTVKQLENHLIWGARDHKIGVIKGAMKYGASVNCIDPQSGLCALHIAVGQNDLPLCRFLIEECAAAFFADKFGRWPSLIAAECEVDDELADYIVECEARYLEEHPSS